MRKIVSLPVGNKIQHKKYRKGNYAFEYLTEKQFSQMKKNRTAMVYGNIQLEKEYIPSGREEEEKNIEVLVLTSNDEESTYLVRVDKPSEVKADGYIRIGEHTWLRIEHKRSMLPLLIIPVLLIIGLGIGIGMRGGTEEKDVNYEQHQIADGKTWNGELPKSGEDTIANTDTIEIPGYSSMVVSKEQPSIDLINSDKNTVYLKYSILEDGTEIYHTDLIRPGQMVEFNAYEVLGVGKHSLEFSISSFDIDSQAPCNGANQLVQVEVKG